MPDHLAHQAWTIDRALPFTATSTPAGISCAPIPAHLQFPRQPWPTWIDRINALIAIEWRQAWIESDPEGFEEFLRTADEWTIADEAWMTPPPGEASGYEELRSIFTPVNPYIGGAW